MGPFRRRQKRRRKQPVIEREAEGKVKEDGRMEDGRKEGGKEGRKREGVGQEGTLSLCMRKESEKRVKSDGNDG